MADAEPQGQVQQNLDDYRQQVMQRFQCSEEEANIRIASTFQALLQAPPQNQDSIDNPPPIPPPHPPTPPPIDEETQLFPKKRNDFPDFDLDTAIADHIPHHPSQYAVSRLENREYVELWYFTTEGCKEASKATPTAADDTFGILNTESGLALQSIKATKASRNAIADENLTWEQIMTARHTLLSTVNRINWPEKYSHVLAQFYIGLEGRKAAGDNPRALISYHAVLRRQWHEAMRGRGELFNPSLFNEILFSRIENKLRDEEREELKKQASNKNSPIAL